MSLKSRREYLIQLRLRYAKTTNRAERTNLIDELVAIAGYHRKYAIKLLNGPEPQSKPRTRRKRPKKYQEALPAIQMVWEALDYPCAERLHPVLLPTAELLARHGELHLDDQIRVQLSSISRTTLGRRLAGMKSPKAKRMFTGTKTQSRIKKAVPIGRYRWDEDRCGALEIDLVEHNGGSSSGHYAFTINVVDVVTMWSRRQAVLGRAQSVVFPALSQIIQDWPYPVWSLHTDNGSEFLNGHLIRFARKHNLEFNRSRPYKKNDSPHVEQKNRQLVRDIVGYDRYDSQPELGWLNQVYQLLDPYVNLFQPSRKVVSKVRNGARVRKSFDLAKTPLQRVLDADILDLPKQAKLLSLYKKLNPMALHRQLERLMAQDPCTFSNDPQAERVAAGRC